MKNSCGDPHIYILYLVSAELGSACILYLFVKLKYYSFFISIPITPYRSTASGA